MAGAALQHFTAQVELAGGTVYVPVGWGQLPEVPYAAATAR